MAEEVKFQNFKTFQVYSSYYLFISNSIKSHIISKLFKFIVHFEGRDITPEEGFPFQNFSSL